VQGIAVRVDEQSNYQLSASHINEYWSETTRAAMVSSPSNPTGSLLSQQQMQSLIKAVNSKQGHLIVDEIYQGLVYDEDNYTALSFSDDVFVINSFSKYFGMTGWRLGWMVVPENYIDAVDRVAQNLFLAPPTMSQYAALAAFTPECEAIFARRAQTFKERRDYLMPILQEMGFKISVIPQGAFYIYADCSHVTNDSFAWVNELLEKEGVAITPGIDFGEYNANTHVRFSYTRPIEELERACSRLSRFIK
jgi:aspartate/methionine/tyrosine aminotransferase